MCLGVSTIYMAVNVSFWFLQNPKKTLNLFEVMLKLVVSCHIATGNRKSVLLVEIKSSMSVCLSSSTASFSYFHCYFLRQR